MSQYKVSMVQSPKITPSEIERRLQLVFELILGFDMKKAAIGAGLPAEPITADGTQDNARDLEEENSNDYLP
jgi:hypothetical protein